MTNLESTALHNNKKILTIDYVSETKEPMSQLFDFSFHSHRENAMKLLSYLLTNQIEFSAKQLKRVN